MKEKIHHEDGKTTKNALKFSFVVLVVFVVNSFYIQPFP
jgi:hypothetical protein